MDWTCDSGAETYICDVGVTVMSKCMTSNDVVDVFGVGTILAPYTIHKPYKSNTAMKMERNKT